MWCMECSCRDPSEKIVVRCLLDKLVPGPLDICGQVEYPLAKGSKMVTGGMRYTMDKATSIKGVIQSGYSSDDSRLETTAKLGLKRALNKDCTLVLGLKFAPQKAFKPEFGIALQIATNSLRLG